MIERWRELGTRCSVARQSVVRQSVVRQSVVRQSVVRQSVVRQSGYTLVVLVVMITVMNIAVAMALPVWSTVIQREKEEELIFRGSQYAEAIRVFHMRQGRMPNTLEELLKVRPRSIRQLWKDPMTDSLDWGLVLSPVPRGQRGQQLRPGEHPGNIGRLAEDAQKAAEEEEGNGLDPSEIVGTPEDPAKRFRGPIRGVYSRSTDDGFRTLFNRSKYNQWKFTVDQLITIGEGPVGQDRGKVAKRGQSLRLSVRWLGRPFRPGVGEGGIPGAAPALPASTMELTPPGGPQGGGAGGGRQGGGQRQRPGGR